MFNLGNILCANWFCCCNVSILLNITSTVEPSKSWFCIISNRNTSPDLQSKPDGRGRYQSQENWLLVPRDISSIWASGAMNFISQSNIVSPTTVATIVDKPTHALVKPAWLMPVIKTDITPTARDQFATWAVGYPASRWPCRLLQFVTDTEKWRLGIFDVSSKRHMYRCINVIAETGADFDHFTWWIFSYSWDTFSWHFLPPLNYDMLLANKNPIVS